MQMFTEILILVITSVIPFLPGIQESFIFDDKPAILDNKMLHFCSLSTHNLFSKDFWGKSLSSNTSHKSFRPLTSFTYWIQLRYFKSCDETGVQVEVQDSDDISLNRVAAHMKLTNIMLNCINSILLYFVLKKLLYFKVSKDLNTCSYLPVSISLFFSVHPVHVEPVISIVGRADLLYTSFFLITILIFPQQTSRMTVSNYCVVLMLAAVSLACKEQGLLILPMLAAINLPTINIKQKSSLIFIIFIIISISVLAFIRLKLINFEAPVFRAQDNPIIFTKGFTRVMSTIYLTCLNCLVLILPNWLCFDWSMGCVPLLRGFTDYRIFAVLFFLFILSGLVIKSLDRCGRLVYLGLCFFCIPFLLCLNILLNVGFVLAERNLYLSVAGFSIIYHSGFTRLLSTCTKNYQRILMKMLHAWVIFILFVRTVHRSFDWQSDLSLYRSGLKVCPSNGKVYYNLAKVISQSSDKTVTRLFLQGHEHSQDLIKLLYIETIRQAPKFEHAFNNLANILKDEGDLKTARRLLRRAVNINNNFPAAHMNLGIVLMRQGQYDEARSHYEHALQLRYPYPDCVYNLGILYLKMEDFTQAQHYFRLGLTWDHLQSYLNLIILLDNLEKYKEAREIAFTGLKLFPKNADFRFHLGNIHGKMGEYEQAQMNYEEALRIENKPSYLLNLGVLYHRWGKVSEALKAYENVLKLKPNHIKAKTYIKQLRKK